MDEEEEVGYSVMSHQQGPENEQMKELVFYFMGFKKSFIEV